MDKKKIIELVVEQIEQELATLANAARQAHETATHEDSKADNKYDTFGLEASYLAGAQATKAQEAQEAIAEYSALKLESFNPTTPIAVSAYVEVQSASHTISYFLGPSRGGTEVTLNGKEVCVITPHSPIGQALLGKKVGQSVLAPMGKLKIVSVI